MLYNKNANGSLTFRAMLDDNTLYSHTFYDYSLSECQELFKSMVETENSRFFWNEG